MGTAERPQSGQPLWGWLSACPALPLSLRVGLCCLVGLLAAAHLHVAQLEEGRPAPRPGRRLAIALPWLLVFLALPLLFCPDREPILAALASNWPCLSSLLVSTALQAGWRHCPQCLQCSFASRPFWQQCRHMPAPPSCTPALHARLSYSAFISAC